MKEKHVLILGAGVAGLHCARRLAKKASQNLRITLVDKSDMHVLKADLYEVATAFNPVISEACMVKLKGTVATPILSLLDPDCVRFVQDKVLRIEPEENRVRLERAGELIYDYLVVALGSESNFFDIPGAKQYSFPFKTLQHALQINCHLDHLFYEVWKKKKKKALHITIGGGGATGVEMASELYFSLKKLCRKYKVPRFQVHVDLIQSGHNLGGLNEKGTRKILERLEGMGVCIYRGYRITKVSQNTILLLDAWHKKSVLPTSMLIWTAGVHVHALIQQSLGDKKKEGAIPVHASLQSHSYKNVFAAGDNAFLENPQEPGKRIPMLAHPAWEEGNMVADNILRSLNREKLRTYHPSMAWMILPLGGKYALLKAGLFWMSGFWPWFLRRLVILRYHFSTMSFHRAYKKWTSGGKIFEQND